MRADSEIVRRSVEHPEIFEEIFARHFDAVLAYARRRLGPVVGEEIAAQTFLVAFEHRARFDPAHASARPWLLGISNNLIRHHLRHERVHLAAIARVPIDVPAEDVDDPSHLDAERLGPALARALLALSATDRETFLLIALTDLSYEEAASSLGIPIGTVRSRIHRSRLILRERVGELGAIPFGQEEDD